MARNYNGRGVISLIIESNLKMVVGIEHREVAKLIFKE
jgi:hypothetical protein